LEDAAMTDNPLTGWLEDDPRREPQAGRSESDVSNRPVAGTWDVEGSCDQRPWAAQDSWDRVGDAPAPGSAADIGEPSPEPWQPGEEAQRGRGRRLLVMAVLPWAVAATTGAVLFLGGEHASAPSAAPPDVEADSSPHHLQASAPAGDDGALHEERVEVADTSAMVAPGAQHDPAQVPADLVAAAAIAVRMAVTTDAEPTSRYVDLVTAESADREDDHAIVTVRAVLLEGSEGRWSSVRTARYAVALALPSLQPLGAPWALPAPEASDPAPLPLALPEDPTLIDELAAVVGDAGYREVTIEGLAAAPAGDRMVVRVRGVGPGEPTEGVHDVWLDGSATRVLGLMP
jgi:hypothetical protein